MARQPFSPSLFDAFPHPVLLLQGALVLYANPAALALAPQLTGSQDLLPQELSSLSGGAQGCCTVFSRSWQFTASPCEEGILLLLFPLPQETPFPLSPARLTQQLRQHLGNLSAASHLLSPVIQNQHSAKHDQYLAIMNQSFYRLFRLIDNTDAARVLSEGSAPFRPGALDLSAFLEEVFRQSQPLARMMEVELRCRNELPILLTAADRSLLLQCLLSLLSNAFRAAGKGGEVELSLVHSRDRALLSVTDNGPGLPPDSAGEGGLPSPGVGLGLGLPLARRVALLHGGALLLEDRPGQGLRAVVSLPIVRAPATTLRSPSLAFTGGFSPYLLAFSEQLPWQAFLPDELD